MIEELEINYNKKEDFLEINGIRYSCSIFRKLGSAFEIGKPFIFLGRNDGVVSVRGIRFEEDLTVSGSEGMI